MNSFSNKIFIVLLFFPKFLFTQVESEGLSVFGNDLDKIKIKAFSNKIKKINVTIRPFQEYGLKSSFKEKISFKFPNDSIVIERFGHTRQRDYGIIKNGQIHEYDIKKKIDVCHKNQKDSADYKVNYSSYYNGKGTFFKVRSSHKFDSSSRITESFIDSIGERPAILYTFEYIGDTITITKRFDFINGKFIPSDEQFEQKSKFYGQFRVDTLTRISNNSRVVTLITKTFFYYVDDKLSRTEIFEYSTYEQLLLKHTMDISYKFKK